MYNLPCNYYYYYYNRFTFLRSEKGIIIYCIAAIGNTADTSEWFIFCQKPDEMYIKMHKTYIYYIYIDRYL